jgi:hypothetical protein
MKFATGNQININGYAVPTRYDEKTRNRHPTHKLPHLIPFSPFPHSSLKLIPSYSLSLSRVYPLTHSARSLFVPRFSLSFFSFSSHSLSQGASRQVIHSLSLSLCDSPPLMLVSLKRRSMPTVALTLGRTPFMSLS